MKNKMKVILSMLVVGLVVLTGCAVSDESEDEEIAFESFSLRELGSMPAEDEENPTLYIVIPETDNDKVRIYRNDLGDGVLGQKEEIHDLESVTITDEEIVIGYNGQEDRFERLSESVAMNENNIRYQYDGE